MEYIDQSLNDLKMNIILDQFDISLLNIVEEETLQIGNIIIRASIIGASHAVSFIDAKTNKLLFTEVVANVDVKKQYPVVANNVHFSNILKSGMNSFSMKSDVKNQLIDYEILFETLETSQNEDVDKVLSLKDDNSIYLSFTFSKKDETETVDARTIVIVKTSESVSGHVYIKMETIHVYPNENQSLKTTTNLKIKENTMQDTVMINAKELIKKINEAGLGENESKIIDIIYSMTKNETTNEDNTESTNTESTVENEFDKTVDEISRVTEEATKTLKKGVETIETGVKAGVESFKEKVNSEEVQESLKQVKDGVNGLLNGFLKSKDKKTESEEK